VFFPGHPEVRTTPGHNALLKKLCETPRSLRPCGEAPRPLPSPLPSPLPPPYISSILFHNVSNTGTPFSVFSLLVFMTRSPG
jgi:hypothetical protein